MALSACKHRVSDSISLPSRGSFRLSLTVLVHYRSPISIQPYGMVPAHSHGISRAPCYSGYYHVIFPFTYQTFTIYGLIFQTILLGSMNQLCSPNPKKITFSGLGSFYFARHYSRNRFFFLFLWVLRCFSSPRSLLMCYFTYTWIYRLFFLYEFPHSDIPGYNGYVLLPEAYRSLSRPSSAFGAQAFTLRSQQLNLLYDNTLRSAVLDFVIRSSMYQRTPSSRLPYLPCITRVLS